MLSCQPFSISLFFISFCFFPSCLPDFCELTDPIQGNTGRKVIAGQPIWYTVELFEWHLFNNASESLASKYGMDENCTKAYLHLLL